MRRKACLLLSLIVLVGCEPTMRENGESGTPVVTPNAAALTVPPNPCTGCVMSPTTFVRPDGAQIPILREFPGDPQADYLLIVQDDGKEGTGAEIKLNGETIVPKAALPSFAVVEVKQSVKLKATNRLTVLPVGKVGAKVVVWILGGSKEIDQSGGSITAPGGLVSVVVPAGALPSKTVIQVTSIPTDSTDSGLAGPEFSPFGLEVQLLPAGTVFAGGRVEITVRDPGSAGAGYFDAAFPLLVDDQGGVELLDDYQYDASNGTIRLTVPHFSRMVSIRPAAQTPPLLAHYWAKSVTQLTYYLAPDNTNTLWGAQPGWDALIAAAIEEWDQYQVQFQLMRTFTKSGANVVVEGADLSFAIGRTTPFLIGSLNSSDQVTVTIDNNETSGYFSTLDPTPLVSVVKHEVGHALGLAHRSTFSSNTAPNGVPIMWVGLCHWWNFCSPAEIAQAYDREVSRIITGDDIAALQYRYGAPSPGTLLYSDNFSNGLGNWVEHDPDGLGSWATSNGELIGDYNIGCGSPTCNQTQLLLADNLQPSSGNWRMEVQSGLTLAYCCYNGGAMINAGKFALWVSDGEKHAIDAGLSWQGTQAPATANTAYTSRQSYPWQSLGFTTVSVSSWIPANWQTVALEKNGNQYTVFFNGVQINTFSATFTSAPKVGFSTYGQVRMDNFKLFSLP